MRIRRWSGGPLSITTIGVSHLDTTGAEGGSDGVGVDPKACSDSGEGPSLPVQVHRLIDLLVFQSVPARGHAVASQVSGDGGAVDPELDREVLDGGSGAVAVYERRDVGRGKIFGLPCGTRCPATCCVTCGC